MEEGFDQDKLTHKAVMGMHFCWPGQKLASCWFP